jgi:hypothetical protein
MVFLVCIYRCFSLASFSSAREKTTVLTINYVGFCGLEATKKRWVRVVLDVFSALVAVPSLILLDIVKRAFTRWTHWSG